ncbi:hypothetical protein HY380_01165 [Candidatus Saccharibacteria bacterium]|nr:hypothetical protein [Candidatus Saccharibacteria bacterium]
MTYSSSVAVSRRRYIKRHHNTVSAISAARRLGPVSNTIILITLFCLIFLLYLTQVTRTNNYGYTINSLQQRQTELQQQKADLEVASARLQSLDRISSSRATQSLVSVSPAGSLR